MASAKKGPPIRVDESRCSGCLICELRCSLRFERAVNPSRSAIRVMRLVDKDREYEIAFTEKCDNCGICARFCPYGALAQEREAALR